MITQKFKKSNYIKILHTYKSKKNLIYIFIISHIIYIIGKNYRQNTKLCNHVRIIFIYKLELKSYITVINKYMSTKFTSSIYIY